MLPYRQISVRAVIAGTWILWGWLRRRKASITRALQATDDAQIQTDEDRVSPLAQLGHRTLPLIQVCHAEVTSVIHQTKATARDLGARIRANATKPTAQSKQSTSWAADSDRSAEAVLKTTDAVIEGLVSDVMHSSEMALQIAAIMDEVDRSTKAITGMIDEIEFIADETRLLALNAAIEATRAGNMAEDSPSSPTKLQS